MSRDSAAVPFLTPELIRRYDRPGPRYTSYPTAVEFSDRYGPDEYLADLAAANLAAAKPLSIYIHLPFCEDRCTFCACNVIITRKRDIAVEYLDRLSREFELIAEHLPRRRSAIQIHLGGGTPTYHTPGELWRLHNALTRHFEILPGAEASVEVDPSVTTEAHLQALREMGFNRLSMGAQDLTPEVQQAVRRGQTLEETQRLFREARRLGFQSINLDLIYGLPLQRLETFRANIEAVIALRPDRVALYSFAHLPWIRRNQSLIDSRQLPSPELKIELFAMAMERFLAAGYRKIGMDHFAVPEDELARALDERRLHRNFMGYTVRPTDAAIGFGVSAIGDLRGGMMQNTKKLTRYYAALEAGVPPVERGYRATPDDLIRRDVIQSVMCNFYVDFTVIEAAYGIECASYFAEEADELASLEAGGLIRRDESALAVTPLGQYFVRNVAMVFDAYLKRKSADRPMFSRTV